MTDTVSSSSRPALDAQSLGANSILVVDDTFVLRERLAEAFVQRGFRVETAGNYDEALRVFTANPTDLAVIDLRMPGRSGLDLLQAIKRHRPATRVVMLSGFGSIPTAVDSIRMGATNFISKPADADDILNVFSRGEQPSEQVADTETFPTPVLARAEWEHIHRVLADCGGNISEAARRLGIHRRSLQRKLRKRAPEDPGGPVG